MGFLKRTKSIFHFQDKKSPGFQKPPPLPSLSETPALSTIPTVSHRQTLQKQPDLPAHHITADNIRELRELIRHKYALDIEIWKQREVKEFARDHCKENMRRSDAALVTIKTTLHAWDRREFFTSEDEYKKFREIKDRLISGNKIVWGETPPWELVKRRSVPVRAPYEMNGRPSSVTPPWHGSHDYSRPHPPPPPPQKLPYQRAVSDPQHGQRVMSASQQVPGHRPVPSQHQRIVSAPQHLQGFAAPQQTYQAFQPQAFSPRYA